MEIQMPGAGCIIISRNTNRFLVGRRSKIESLPGTWGIPGGNCDAGEDLISTVKREVFEETGYSLDMSTPIEYLGCSTESNGFQFHTFLKWINYEFKPIKSAETDKFKWIKNTNEVSPIHSGLLELVKNPIFVEAILKKEERARLLSLGDRILLKWHQVSF